MAIVERLVSELGHEGGTTRKLLERLPEEHLAWKPHQKSMTLGQLGSHLAEILEWTIPILEEEELRLNLEDFTPYIAGSKREILEKFDINLSKAMEELRDKSDPFMFKIWRMKTEQKVLIEMPRIDVVRTMILSHSIHHRGQLTVYLRLKDALLPAIYGPSADDRGQAH